MKPSDREVEPTESAGCQVDEDDLEQLRERLRWTPAERLRYLTDMVAFEERARRARRVPG